MTGFWRAFTRHLLRIGFVVPVCVVVGIAGAVRPAFWPEAKEGWVPFTVFAAWFLGIPVGAHAALSPRRALLEGGSRPLGVASARAVAAMLVSVAGLSGILVPFLVANREFVADARVRGYTLFAFGVTAAATGCGLAAGNLVRAPLVGVVGLVVTGITAVATLFFLVRVFGPIGAFPAAVVTGLPILALGGAASGVAGLTRGGLERRRTAWWTALTLPLAAVPVLVPASVVGSWMASAPPSEFDDVSTIEVAPAGRWALVTGSIETDRRQHALVELGGNRFFRVEGPVQRLAFTPDGRGARWTEGGVFGSRVHGIDLASGRRWSCGGLPMGARILDADATRVAIATRDGTRVLEAETCRRVASLAREGWRAAARFVGERLRVWEQHERDTTIRELDLGSGSVEQTGSLGELVWNEYVTPDGARIVLGRLEERQVFDGRTGAVLARHRARWASREDELLPDGTLVSIEGGWSECPRVVVEGPDGAAVPIPERTPPDAPSCSREPELSLFRGPAPGTVVVCGCGACDVLDLGTRAWRLLPGVHRVWTNGPNGESTRPDQQAWPGLQLGYDDHDQLVTFTADGTVRSVWLP